MEKNRQNYGEMASTLEAKLETVLALRRAGRSWPSISAELTKAGTPTTHQNLWKWWQRRRAKAAKIARELRPFDELASSPSTGRKPAATVSDPIRTAGEAAAVISTRAPKQKPQADNQRWEKLEKLKKGLPPG